MTAAKILCFNHVYLRPTNGSLYNLFFSIYIVVLFSTKINQITLISNKKRKIVIMLIVYRGTKHYK